MKHGIKKLRLGQGQDATQSIIRKLALNFIEHGKIETTLKRAKALKGTMDRLVYKSQTGTEASKNVLLRKLADRKVVHMMMTEIAPKMPKTTGGYVRLIRLGRRQGDNAEMARVVWTTNITADKAQPKERVASDVKKAAVKAPAKKAPSKKAPAKKTVTKKKATSSSKTEK